DQRPRLGKTFARHHALGHSKNSAAKKRRRSQRRRRASLGSIRRGTDLPWRTTEYRQRELLCWMISLTGQLLLNGSLELVGRNCFRPSGRFLFTAQLRQITNGFAFAI